MYWLKWYFVSQDSNKTLIILKIQGILNLWLGNTQTKALISNLVLKLVQDFIKSKLVLKDLWKVLASFKFLFLNLFNKNVLSETIWNKCFKGSVLKIRIKDLVSLVLILNFSLLTHGVQGLTLSSIFPLYKDLNW